MLPWVFSVEERDLHDWNVQRVRVRIEGTFETRPYTVVQPTVCALGINACVMQSFEDPLGNLSATNVWILLLVVVLGKAVKVVNELGVLCSVDSYFARRLLPVGRKDYDGLWLDLACDFLANFLELVISWMLCLEHDIGLQAQSVLLKIREKE